MIDSDIFFEEDARYIPLLKGLVNGKEPSLETPADICIVLEAVEMGLLTRIKLTGRPDSEYFTIFRVTNLGKRLVETL